MDVETCSRIAASERHFASDRTPVIRYLSPRGYQIAQCANTGVLGKTIPDLERTLVPDKHLLHEQVEKVLFLCSREGVDQAREVGQDLVEEVSLKDW